MTDTKLLEKCIGNSGLKYKYIAEQIGISYYSLRKKMDNITEFTATEIDMICEVLAINSLEERQRIFFAKIVDL